MRFKSPAGRLQPGFFCLIACLISYAVDKWINGSLGSVVYVGRGSVSVNVRYAQYLPTVSRQMVITSPTTAAGARGCFRCVGWLVVPRLHRQSFLQRYQAIAACPSCPFSRFLPWKEQVPVGCERVTSQSSREGFQKLQLLHSHCPLPVLRAHSSCPLAHYSRPLTPPVPRPYVRPFLFSDDDDGLPPQFSALTAESGRHIQRLGSGLSHLASAMAAALLHVAWHRRHGWHRRRGGVCIMLSCVVLS